MAFSAVIFQHTVINNMYAKKYNAKLLSLLHMIREAAIYAYVGSQAMKSYLFAFYWAF